MCWSRTSSSPKDQAFITRAFCLPRGIGERPRRGRDSFSAFPDRPEPLWMLYNVFLVIQGVDGKPAGWATVSRDITDRKRAEEAFGRAKRSTATCSRT